MEDFNHAHIVPLRYKLITGAKYSDDLSIGFDRDRNRRREELTIKKHINGKHHLTKMLTDVFGFAEHQEKGSFGFGYKSTLTRNKDEAVLDKAADIADATI